MSNQNDIVMVDMPFNPDFVSTFDKSPRDYKYTLWVTHKQAEILKTRFPGIRLNPYEAIEEK